MSVVGRESTTPQASFRKVTLTVQKFTKMYRDYNWGRADIVPYCVMLSLMSCLE